MFTEPISILILSTSVPNFTIILLILTTLLGKHCLFQKSKLLVARYEQLDHIPSSSVLMRACRSKLARILRFSIGKGRYTEDNQPEKNNIMTDFDASITEMNLIDRLSTSIVDEKYGPL